MNMSRRQFVAAIVASGLSRALAESAGSGPACRIERLTRGPRHHFFGYYGICPWNQSGRHMLCLESSFQDHLPAPAESAGIGLVDTRTGEFSPVGKTCAWNLQQGAMLHWNPLNPETEVIYNDREAGDVVAVVLDVGTGKMRRLPRAASAVSHNGGYALSLTYGRLARLRKVVGYAGVEDPNPDAPHPDNDGVFLVDLTTGQSKLIVSIRQVYDMLRTDHPDLADKHMWFNHTVFNSGDTRFLFLARTWGLNGRLQTGMFTADVDGSDLRQVIPYGKSVSHFDWRNDREIVATFDLDGRGRTHVLFTEGRDDYRRIGDGDLDFDGHCTFSPDQRWLATDRKDASRLVQALILHSLESGECTILAELDMKDRRLIGGDLRCDFHPRWNRSGDTICFDAIEPAGTRQIHIAHLTFA